MQRWKKQHSRRAHKIFWPLFIILAVAVGSLSYYLSSQTISDGVPKIATSVQKNQPSVGGQIIELSHIATLSTEQVDNLAKVVYPGTGIPQAKSQVEEYLVTYTSQDPRNGRQILIRGRFYIPTGGNNLTAFVFGPGTTGIAPQCAPSLEVQNGKNWGRYDNHMSFYAGQGFAVATTDYDGRLEPNDIHHYFVGELEGRMMLDTMRALRKFKDPLRYPENPVGTKSFLAGYSEGGFAALWADQEHASYAPELHVNGVIGFAPTADLTKTLYDTVLGGATTIWLPPLVLASYQDYYGMKMPVSAVLKDPYASTLDQDVRMYCIDQLEMRTGRYGTNTNVDNVYQPQLIASLRDGSFPQQYSELSSLFTRNLVGAKPTATPVLIISGERDEVILPSAQQQLMQRLCTRANESAQWQLYPNVTHYTAMEAGRVKAFEWMSQITQGTRPASDCGKYR